MRSLDNYIISDDVHFRQLTVAFLTVFVPFLSTIYATYYILNFEVSYYYIFLWAVMHFLGMTGISNGYHRLASHNSYKATKLAKYFFLICGSMSAQGPVIYWASNHRRHHKFCDKGGDVHSPYVKESSQSIHNTILRFWHSHTGWMFQSRMTNPLKFSTDLLKDRDIKFINRNYYKWIILGIILPGVVSFLFFNTLTDFMLGCLFGGLVRVFTVQHCTWSINSITHMFGHRSFKVNDHSRNLWILSILTSGESWHNNHHTFPYSSRLGLSWWQVDPGYICLKLFKIIGLVKDLKVPTKEKIEIRKRVNE